jgi:hypothetical protein
MSFEVGSSVIGSTTELISAAQLNDGLKQEQDDVIPLEYCPFDDEDVDMDEAEEDEDVVMDDISLDMPPSPIPRRYSRPDWLPPDHIPDFLPPFPVPTIQESRPASPSPIPEHPSMLETEERLEPSGAITAAAPSDFNTRVPYDQSSIALLPEWHLHFPNLPPEPTPQITYPLPQKDRALYAAYHGLLTSTPETSQHNPARHRVAMSLLELVSGHSGKGRWDLPDTLFGNLVANKPRVSIMAPSHPVPLNKTIVDAKLPVTAPTTGILDSGWSEGVEALVNTQGGRIGLLAKEVLPVRCFFPSFILCLLMIVIYRVPFMIASRD